MVLLSVGASEGQGQLFAALFSLLSVARGTMDLAKDGRSGKAIDPDMAFNSNPGPFDIMALDGSTGHSDLYGPVEVQLLDTKMALGGGLES